ncbi:MAG TPA: GntR family transcriptional regulator [Arenicellales bacterium]|nr:GntR family transcriptional regulator [Gammaproteobacteria bacterium]MDP7220072.1 GntR family transcriptional regulator [Arenicellales bacterium]HJP11470.1 GntR family transcriptional regulator [Arenicellales bacterium]
MFIDKIYLRNAKWYSKYNAKRLSSNMTSTSSGLLIDVVYSNLRGLIVSNALTAGQKLVDRDLAELLGVSRTPIREALGRLAMTGLVEKRARRGYYVSRFSVDEVKDLYEFRKMLEIHSVKLAVQNAQPSHLVEFDRVLSELTKLSSDLSGHAKAVELDIQIHELIARASGNTSLHQAMQNVLHKVMCFISVEIAGQDSLVAAHQQHQSLLHLIKERDAKRAVELIRMHVDTAKETLVSVLQTRDQVWSDVLAVAPSKTRGSNQEVPKLNNDIHQGETL